MKRGKPLKCEAARRKKADSEEKGKQKYGKQRAGALASSAAPTLLAELSSSSPHELSHPRAPGLTLPCSSTWSLTVTCPAEGKVCGSRDGSPPRLSAPACFLKGPILHSVGSFCFILLGLLRKRSSPSRESLGLCMCCFPV